MKNMKIRKATKKDVALLMEIIRKSFRDVAQRFDLTPQNCPRHASNCQKEWIKKDMERGVTYFIIEEEGLASGCVALEIPDSALGYMERLAVLPDKRRRGFGEALVDYVFQYAKRTGARRVSIGVIAAQSELKKWYQKIGFVETQTKEFAHLPFQVTFMSRDADTNR